MGAGMTAEDITAAVQAGSLTHEQGIQLYSVLYAQQLKANTAPALLLPCEDCGKITPLATMVAYKLWVPMPGHPRVAGYDEHSQHFCCSHDCAQRQAVACIQNHLRPEAERRCAQAAQEAAQRAALAAQPRPVPLPDPAQEE